MCQLCTFLTQVEFIAADLPDVRIPMRLYPTPGLERFLQPPLARDRVRYVGEPVAVVLADSRYTAEDAAELVAVDYEPLEPVLGDEEDTLLFEETGTNVAASSKSSGATTSEPR